MQQMSNSINKKKYDFIDFYVKDWLRVSSESSHIINLSKYLMDVLKFNNLEIDKLVSVTTETLQELLNRDKIQLDTTIEWFSLYRNPDWTTKHVDFFIENWKIINTYHSK